MSIKATYDSMTATLTREYPQLRIDKTYGNILLFKTEQIATIIFSPREENIGTQYYNGSYNLSNTHKFDKELTLQNIKDISEIESAEIKPAKVSRGVLVNVIKLLEKSDPKQKDKLTQETLNSLYDLGFSRDAFNMRSPDIALLKEEKDG